MKKIIALGLVLVSVPFISSAAGIGDTQIGGILVMLSNWLTFIIPGLITIAVIYFIVGVVSFMTSSDEEAKKKGRTKIINGLIALFVIVAFWGIISLVKGTFGIGNITGQNITPCVPIAGDASVGGNNMGEDC